MKGKILTAIVALVFGVLGVGLALVGAHLWNDHLVFHELVRLEAQRQQAAQKPSPPAQ